MKLVINPDDDGCAVIVFDGGHTITIVGWSAHEMEQPGTARWRGYGTDAAGRRYSVHWHYCTDDDGTTTIRDISCVPLD